MTLFGFLSEVALLVVVVASACAVVGWVVPEIARRLADSLADCVAFVAAALLLPEYWVSAAARRRDRSPPTAAYQYGDAVVGTAGLVQALLRAVCRAVAAAADEVPPVAVGIVAAAVWVFVRFF
jgi:hypothetical protein